MCTVTVIRNLVLLLAVLASVSPSFAGNRDGNLLECYSNVHYVPQEGEYVGINIVLVREESGTMILFQESNGSPGKPLLLQATTTADGFDFEVPTDSDTRGIWHVRRAANGLSLTSPLGGKSAQSPVCH